MKKTLYDYKREIEKLPIKDKYTKEELLIEDFLIDKENNIEIYYAPHNEYINPKAKILIVGITPGFIQMNTAISTARKELENYNDIEDIQYKCKVSGRFSGSLRKNIISMLDEIKLNELDDFEDILLIPLGKAVEEVLCKLKEEKFIKENQILMGFPHPSGANVNRLVQLEENKKSMIDIIKKTVSS